MNDRQVTHSTWVLSCSGLLQDAGDSDSPAICSMSVGCCLCVWFQARIDLSDSWDLTFDMYKNEIRQRNGHLVIFVSTHHRDLTLITCSLSCQVFLFVLLFRMQWSSQHILCFVRVNPMYEPWHNRLNLSPCFPYLVTSNIGPKIKVNTRSNGKCSEKELIFSSGWQLQQLNKAVDMSKSSNNWREVQLGGRQGPSVGGIAQLKI